MKRSKQNSATPPGSNSKGEPTRTGPSSPARRKWLFRLMALAVPVAILVLIEVCLRAFGYGYSAGFFLKSKVGGREVFIENQKFGERFFPPGLARSPQPTVMPAPKPPGTYRIFIFGESAAMGDPEPAFGFGRILEVMLGAQFPGSKFEVVNVAVTAINSHVIRAIAKDCADKQGDVWIIYMGNNEVVGPFGAGTVFGTQAPSLSVVRASIALKATRLGQLLDALKRRLGGQAGVPASWEGMEMFLKQQIRQDDQRMGVVYQHFEKNLDDIVRLGESAGARVIVSTVAANVKDCAPFGSLHREGLTEAQLAGWKKFHDAGLARETAGNAADAIAPFQSALSIDDRFAETHFRLGRCFLALGKFDQAGQHFEKARDLDTLRFRADTRITQLIQAVAARHNGVKFVDAIGLFATNSPHGIAGEEFFYEHVHFNFAGNYLLARAFAGGIASLLPMGVTNTAAGQGALLSAADCARRLALTDWDRHQVLDEVCKRLQQPPFTLQLDATNRDQRLLKQLADLQPAARGRGLNEEIENYQRAIATSPGDWVLRENFAKLLQEFGKMPAAEEQWRKVLEFAPHYTPAYYSLGNALDAQGRSAEAMPFFQQALQRRPDSHEARNALGLSLASQGKPDEAIREFQEALRRKPDFGEARVNLGQILSALGRREEARAQYLEALRRNSNNVAAYINLGKITAADGKFAEAAVYYEAAVRLRPDHAIAHFNLGNTLSALGRPDSFTEYEAAVRLDPNFAEARNNLGLELAKRNRSSEAMEQFAEVVRLKPEFVEGHLNYGVALARAQRFDEAIARFRETLRRDPGNVAAKKFLDQALVMRGGK